MLVAISNKKNCENLNLEKNPLLKEGIDKIKNNIKKIDILLLLKLYISIDKM